MHVHATSCPSTSRAGTVTQFASARPFNATTGIDNNGDGANNDRPVVDGEVIKKSAFRGTPTSDVAAFVEGRIHQSTFGTVLLRLEGFNLLNHGNYLGRGQTVYGDTGDSEPHVRPARRRRQRDERPPGVRQHRPAADVPGAVAVSFLSSIVHAEARRDGESSSPRPPRLRVTPFPLEDPK